MSENVQPNWLLSGGDTYLSCPRLLFKYEKGEGKNDVSEDVRKSAENFSVPKLY
jgi:hypothetical protein